MKLKYLKHSLKGFAGYLYYAIIRWFTPRTYLVSYTYMSADKQVHESSLYRMFELDMPALMQRLTARLGMSEIHIDSITEVPAVNVITPVIGAVEEIINKADKAAEDIKNSPALPAESLETPSQEKEALSSEDVDELDKFIKNR